MLLVWSVCLTHAAAEWVSRSIAPITAQTWNLFRSHHKLALDKAQQALRKPITPSSYIQPHPSGGVTRVLAHMTNQEYSDFIQKHPTVVELSSDYIKNLQKTETIIDTWLQTLPLGPTPFEQQTEALYNYLFCIHLETSRLLEQELSIPLCQAKRQVRYPDKLAHLMLDTLGVELDAHRCNRLAAIIIAELGAHEGAQQRDCAAFKVIENSWHEETP